MVHFRVHILIRFVNYVVIVNFIKEIIIIDKNVVKKLDCESRLDFYYDL